MGIQTATLREHELILFDILANNLFDAGRKVNLNKDNLKAVWNEAYYQAVALMAFYNSDSKILANDPDGYIRMVLNQTFAENARIDSEHVRICKILKKADIRCAVLKGCASALYYPDPLMRSMGDVDFIVDSDDFDKADRILAEHGYKKTDKSHDVHNVYFNNICRCEMHFQPSGIPDGKAGEKIKQYLSGLVNEAVIAKTEFGEITVPSTYHHGLVILLHMCHHLTGDGLGLRHLCDWAVFLNKIGESKFLEMFEETFKDIGLWKLAKILTFISCKYLGLPGMSWARDVNPQLADLVLADIVIGGNFGQKTADRSHESLLISSKNEKEISMLQQFIHSANNIVYKNWSIAKKLKFLLPFGWIFFGLRYIIRSLFGQRPKIRPKKVIDEATERMEIYSELRLFEKTKE